MTYPLPDAALDDRRVIVTQFFKWGDGEPIRLWAFTVFRKKTGHGGRTWTSRDEYDVEWCHTTGCYIYHQSGGGGGSRVDVYGPYHVSGNALVRERHDVFVGERAPQWVSARDIPPWNGKRTLKIRRRNRTRRLRQLPMCINQMQPGWDILDWLEHNAINARAVYCSECDDWLPDTNDDPCDHVWWCDKTCWWSTPSERCDCKDREQCWDMPA